MMNCGWQYEPGFFIISIKIQWNRLKNELYDVSSNTYLGGDSKDLEKEEDEAAAAPSNFFRTSSTLDQPDSTLSRRFSGRVCAACLVSSSLVFLTETSGIRSLWRVFLASWHRSMNWRRRNESVAEAWRLSSSSKHLEQNTQFYMYLFIRIPTLFRQQPNPTNNGSGSIFPSYSYATPA